MGTGAWTTDDWNTFGKTTRTASGATKSASDIFARTIHPDFDPLGIEIRESRDSAEHPNATPVAVTLDVTGSMGRIPHSLITDGLGDMVQNILTRQPVADPQIMFMAVGDAKCDRYPLQATQFEADIRIAEQLKQLYLEGGGGGNGGESYHLAWYFLAVKAAIDSFDKRGQKGILFTVGDENIHKTLKADEIKRVFGDDVERDLTSKELLDMLERRFDVFHLQVIEGPYDNTGDHGERWRDLLGERVIPVTDYHEIPAIIVSTLEVMAGRPKADIIASWNGSTAVAVQEAIQGLAPSRGDLAATGGVWRPGLGIK
ncbi:MAG: hypothetical protein PHS57_06465 [Alphaproteobacteria bacterium]|nr:hypothetical protein [Alphaproteobacteria bacterium]